MKRTPWKARRKTTAPNASDLVITAVRLADRYRMTVPSVDTLRDEFGMSTPTAYRWRKSFRIARGQG